MKIPQELEGILVSDPGIMSGAVCFVGSRVPVKNLLDSINGGESLERFLANYSGVTESIARAVLKWQNVLTYGLAKI